MSTRVGKERKVLACYHVSLVRPESKQKGMGPRTYMERLAWPEASQGTHNHRPEEVCVGGQMW